MPLLQIQSVWRPTVLAVVLLTAIALAAHTWQGRLMDSLRTYRPPGATLDVRPVEVTRAPAGGEQSARLVTPPAVQQVILIVVSGLRTDTARRLPTLADLAGRGARGEVAVTPPGAQSAAWGALLTGAGPEWSGSPLLEPVSGAAHALSAETLFAAARRGGLRAGLFGKGPWGTLIPEEPAHAAIAPNSFSVAAIADQSTTEAARETLRRSTVDLTVVGYGHVAQAVATFGARSAEVERAAMAVDGQIEALLRDLDLRRALVIVTGDQGLADGRPTASDEPPRVPFIMVGGSVRAGDYGRIPQTDIAPTAALALGLSPPTLAQGAARGDMLKITDETRARLAVADAAQKLAVERALADVYGDERDRQTVADEIAGLPVTQTTLDLGNDAAGWRLAEPTVREAQRRIEALRRRTVTEGMDQRLAPLLIILGGLAFAAVWRATVSRLLMLGAAGIAFVEPLAAAGVSRAASTALLIAVALAIGLGVVTLWRHADPRAGRMTVAGALAVATLAVGALALPPPSLAVHGVGGGMSVVLPVALTLVWGGAAALATAWWAEASSAEAARLAAIFCLALIGLLAAQLAVLWWQVGAVVVGFLPELRWVAAESLTLARIQAVALGGVALPWLAAAAHMAGTMRLEETVSDTLPAAGSRQ